MRPEVKLFELHIDINRAFEDRAEDRNLKGLGSIDKHSRPDIAAKPLGQST